MSSKAIHIIASRDNDGRLRYALAPTISSKGRAIELNWARQAMYNAMGGPDTTGSFEGTIGLPLAFGTQPMKSERVWNQGCDGMKCPPPTRVKLQSNGGLQPQSVVPRPINRAPARQASSLVTTWVPPHYHKFFCAHDRFRALACSQCKRSAAEGREWLESV
jgi:hypothetical protein